MSDDAASFFDADPIESPSVESALSADPAPAPAAAPDYSAKIAELENKLAASERWRSDFQRMVGGQPTEQAPEDPNAFLQKWLDNPSDVVQSIKQEAVQEATQAFQQQQIIADRTAKHPELAPIQHLINWETLFAQVGQEFQRTNQRAPSFAEALDASIALVKSSMQGVKPAAPDPTRMALNLDLSRNGQPGGGAVNLDAMSDAEFAKYRSTMLRQQYQH